MEIIEKDTVIINLKKKLEAFIDNSLEVSKELDNKERVYLLKIAIDELLDKAMANLIKGDLGFEENDLEEIKKILREYVQDYCDKILSKREL